MFLGKRDLRGARPSMTERETWRTEKRDLEVREDKETETGTEVQTEKVTDRGRRRSERRLSVPKTERGRKRDREVQKQKE